MKNETKLQEPYFYNKLLYKSICQLHESTLKHFQSIATDFKELNFGNITKEDFARITAGNFSELHQRYFKEIESNIDKLGLTNQFVRENMKNGSEVPYNDFHSKTLKNLDNIQFSKSHGPAMPLSITNYTLKNGMVTFTDLDRERIKNNHCIVNLDTDTRRQFAKLAEETFENLKKLKAILVKDNSSLLFGRNALYDEDTEEVWMDKETLHFIK